MSLCSLCLFAPNGNERLLEMTVDARHSYFTFSLAVKKDEVITVLEWQLKLRGRGRKPCTVADPKNPTTRQGECKMYAGMSITLRL